MAAQQLIDAQGSFVGGLPSTNNDESRTYQITAVVGCQSGGKSTLLNHAFGTTFPVLDAPKSGRRRTTLGVWGAVRPTNTKSQTIVLDVEGTDSRERGEGAKAFESRTTLFALALADSVIVNMWAHDIGRYSAANYELFETVFAHAVALRRSAGIMSQRAVNVVIVVRDHDGESNVADIKRVLMGDLMNIWESLKVRGISFESLFELDVVALPHKIYSPKAFETEVKYLARRIYGNDKNKKKESQLVPLSGFNALAKAVWEAICKSTGGDGPDSEFSLDLPKHAALAAHFKCGEAISSSFNGPIGVDIEELRSEIESEWRNPISEFGARIDSIVRKAMHEFDEATSSYKNSQVAKGALERRRTEFGSELTMRMTDLRERYLSVCRDYCMNRFEDEFRPMLGGTNGYDRNAKRLANSFIKQYKTLIESAKLPSELDKYIRMKEESEEQSRISKEQNKDDSDVPDMYGDEVQDSDGEEDVEEYSCERFKRDVLRMVDERKRLGELMLPGGLGTAVNGGPRQDPWWKGLLIRAAILFINYLQATQSQRAAFKTQCEHEKQFPPGPSF